MAPAPPVDLSPGLHYKVTPLGEALGEAVCGSWMWVEKQMKDVERSRRTYDLPARRRQAEGET